MSEISLTALNDIISDVAKKKQVMLRLSPDLHEQVKAVARARGVSVNALINEALEDAAQEADEVAPVVRLRSRLEQEGLLSTWLQPASSTVSREAHLKRWPDAGSDLIDILLKQREEGY